MNLFPSPMRRALEQAQRAFKAGEVPVGAVVVFQNRVISAAHNLCVTLKNATAHAEIVSIRKAVKYLDQPFLFDCDLYVTLEPCAQCAGAIALTRVRRLYFGAYDPKGGAVEHGAKVLQHSLHKPEIIGGIDERQSNVLLKSFFQALRK